jgi:WD40 repeat protein
MQEPREVWKIRLLMVWLIVVLMSCGLAEAQTAGVGNVVTPANHPQLVVQLGHAKDITTAAFSPDSRFLLSGSRDATACLWDTATGLEIRRFIHQFPLWSVAFSLDGRFALTRTSSLIKGRGDYAYLWDTATGQELRRFEGHTADAHAIGFSPDSQSLVTVSDDNLVYLWEVSTGKEIRRFAGHTERVEAVLFSPQGDVILSGSSDHTLRLWDVKTGKEVQRFTGHTDAVHSVAFAPDGQSALSGGADGTARLWETSTGREIRRFSASPSAVTFVSFSPDGHLILTKTAEGGTYLWNASTGQEVQRFEKATFVAFSPDNRFLVTRDKSITLQDLASDTQARQFAYGDPVAFSPDGRFIVTGDSSDKSLRLWEVATGQEVRRFTGQVSAVHAVVFSPDGRLLMTGSNDDKARVWEIATGKVVQQLPHEITVTSGAFSPDGRFLVTGSSAASLWDLTTGKKVRQYEGYALRTAVAFSPNGRIIVAGLSKTVHLWEVATGKEVWQVAHQFPVNSVAFSPDSRFVLTGSGNPDMMHALFSRPGDGGSKMHDGAHILDAATGKISRYIDSLPFAVDSVAFSPDGKFALTASNHNVQLWDVVTGQQVGLRKASFDGTPAVFSPDGKFVLTGSGSFWQETVSIDFTAKLYSSEGKDVQQFVGHSSGVNAVAFSPDSRIVATGSGDGTVRFWNPTTGQELCRLLSFRDGTWVVVDPEGRFDTNNLDNNSGLHWIMPDDPFTPLPLEIFMREYYEPRLLPRILAGEKFRQVRSLTDLIRVQPLVKIKDEPQLSAPDTVTVTVEVAKVAKEFQQGGKKDIRETGVFDLRLFRDGQLVGYAPETAGEIPVDAKTGKAVLTFTVKLPRNQDTQQIEFSAYAFNTDRVKSATDRKTFAVPKEPKPVKGRAYLVTIGVNAYENPAWDLRFAANDARRIERTLLERLARAREYEDVIAIPLISDYALRGGERVVTENRAVKSNVLTVLELLAGKPVAPEQKRDIPQADKIQPARPEDLVLISFSSHGYARTDGIFYFFPFDVGPGQGRQISETLLQHAISSEELSRGLRDIDGRPMVLIVDACQSAASVEGEGFKPGPMGSRGLGQLAYDKGMRILTASQADNVAIESDLIQQGLLTYALVHDGLEAKQADFQPQDHTITLTEWLNYGVERVPFLYEEIQKGRVRPFAGTKHARGVVVLSDPQDSSARQRGVQHPALFDFTRRQRETVLAREK